MAQSTTDIKTASFDPYYFDPRDVMEPPTEFSKIIKKIGPGIILSASISSGPIPRPLGRTLLQLSLDLIPRCLQRGCSFECRVRSVK